MGNVSLRLWILVLLAGTTLGLGRPPRCAAQGVLPSPRQQSTYVADPKPSIGESISASIKQGLGKLGDIVKPPARVKPAEDPTSLANKAKPGSNLYVAVARLYVQAGKLTDAATHYQKALRSDPKCLGALLGYARLKDRMGKPDEARELYLKAVKAHPNEASAHNNLALFCAAHGMYDEARHAFARAIQLQPKNPRYRNNFATLLVNSGRTAEAFTHLSAVHRPAVAQYNLAYLLEKRGDLQGASRHFISALRADSSLAAAGLGLQRVQRALGQPQLGAHPVATGTRLSGRPVRPAGQTVVEDVGQAVPRRPSPQLAPALNPQNWNRQHGAPPGAGPQPSEVAPLPPDPSKPLRLPSTASHPRGATTSAPLPPEPGRRKPTPVAPLPTRATKGPVIRHLPDVD